MDFKAMLNQLSQLSEATKETPTGRVHKAEPGGYGRAHDTDEEGEEKKEKKAEGPKKRGRPPKTGEHSKEEQKKNKARDEAGKALQSAIVGNLPKGHDKKKGTVVKGKAQSGEQKEGGDKKKKSIKEWVEEIEQKYIAEVAPGQELTVKPMPGAAQLVDPATQKVMATGDAAAVKNIQGAVASGKVQMRAEEMTEEQLDELSSDLTSRAYDAAQAKRDAALQSDKLPSDMRLSLAKAASNQMDKFRDYTKIARDREKTAAAQKAASAIGFSPAQLRKIQAQKDTQMTEEGDEKWIQKAVKHPGAFSKKAKAAGKSVAAFAKEKAHAPGTLGKQARLAKTLTKIAKGKEDMAEGEIPHESGVDNIGAGLGAGRSQTTLESKQKVNESMHKHSAARLMGKAHALAKEGYNCKYDDMEEAKHYHEGYKEGLDECYGIRNEPIIGMEENIPATVPGMASQAMPAMEDDMMEMDKTEWMKKKAKETPGPTFKAFGQTHNDSDVLGEFAFEAWDKELNSLLTESEEVNEGMTVSISKGQQGSPDSVSVSAQDGEADQLLGLLKQAGLGLFGGNDSSDYGAPKGETPQHGGVDVVGDHDGMMALIKKVTGGMSHDQDYADEEDEYHDEEHEEDTCNECGYMESKCECEGKEVIDEVESEDQMAYEVAEDNAPDSGAAETTADENAEAAEDNALAVAAQQNKTNTVNEWANQIGTGPGKGTDASFEQDIEFMTKIISGGLNKPKSTGQTTIPVIAGQDTRMEDPMAWARLAGIKK